MRRLLSISLLLIFLLPSLAPLAALGEGPEARVALCCRQGGQHHCMQARTPDGAPRWTAPNRCPMFPRAEAPAHKVRVGVPASELLFGEAVAHPGVPRQPGARARIAQDRARHKRGPPADMLA